jgi:hypothetical protein
VFANKEYRVSYVTGYALHEQSLGGDRVAMKLFGTGQARHCDRSLLDFPN